MTVSYIGTASNSAAGPTTTVTVTTGLTVQVGDLIVVMCRHHGSASSISVSDANNVVPTYTEVTPYTSHSGGNLNSRTVCGVAPSTAALNVTMTTGASRTNLKCIVTQARSTKPAGWTQGANAQRVREGVSNSFPDAHTLCGRTSGLYVMFVAVDGSATFTPGDTLTEVHDSTDWTGYRILEQAGATTGFINGSGSTNWTAHLAFFSDDNEPTTGVRLMNVSQWKLAAGGTSHSLDDSFTAPEGCVLVAKVFADDAQTVTAEYNGVSLVELFQDDLSGAGVGKGSMVFMSVTGADGDAHLLSLTTNASWTGGQFQLEAWAGVETSSVAAAHRTIYSGGDNNSGAGVDLTVVDSEAGDVVWSMCHSYVSDTPLACDGFPVIIETTNPNVSSSNIASQYQVASGASTVVSFTGDDFCTNVAFALVAAAAAAAAAPPHWVGRSGLRLR